MSFRNVPVGAVLTASYYEVPAHYGTGKRYETWDEAVATAREKHAEIKAAVINAGLSETYAIECADTQALVALRWTLEYAGGSTDMEVERHKIKNLRTSAEFAKA